MEIEALRFPLRDGDFISEIPPDVEFPESLVEEIGFEDDGLEFDLDELLVPPDDGSGLSENELSSSFVDLDSGGLEPSPDPNFVFCGAEPHDSSRSGASAVLSPTLALDRGGSTVGVVFKSENASPFVDSGCSSEGSFTMGFGNAVDNRAGGNSPEISGIEGYREVHDCVESVPRMANGPDKGGAKRKKEKGEDCVLNLRAKFLRSDCSVEADSSTVFRQVNEEEQQKKKARLLRNRESAQLSRQRKKHYVEELEDKVKSMSSTIAELSSRIACITAENVRLRQQLGSVYPQPNAHLPPQMAPLGFHWIPCSPYALNSQSGIVFPPGAQVPLVPIPRLKTRQPVSAPKARNSPSKVSSGEIARNSGKVSKKVASVTFLCFFIFLMYSGGLFSVFNSVYGRYKDSVPGRLDYVDSELESRLNGRVLTGLHRVNGTQGVSAHYLRELYMDRCLRRGREGSLHPPELCKECSSLPFSSSDGHVLGGNTSESLVASLYVPRNDKLVRIDGRLIIQSVLASERSVQSLQSRSKETVTNSIMAESGKNGLASTSEKSPALPVPVSGKDMEGLSNFYRKTSEHQKALASSSADDYAEDQNNASSFDGPLKQWFREGISGPILSSGMCTEVFQFEVSPSTTNDETTVIPSTSKGVANSSTNYARANYSSSGMIKNRRFLYPTAIPLPGKTLHNSTSDHPKSSNKEGTFGNNSVSSSMVVSVLLDPRETGENGNMMSSPKSLSRILVVVMVDSVKYVTYSCMLPFKNSSPHL